MLRILRVNTLPKYDIIQVLPVINVTLLSSLYCNSDVSNMLIILLFLNLCLIPVLIYAHLYPAPLSCEWRLTISRFTNRLLYLFAYISKGSLNQDPRDSNLMQYTYYGYTLTDRDLNPLWKLGKRIVDIFSSPEQVEKKFLKTLPDWRLLDKVSHADWSRMGWIAI